MRSTQASPDEPETPRPAASAAVARFRSATREERDLLLGAEALDVPRIVRQDLRDLSAVLYMSLGCAFEEAGPQRGARVCLVMIEDLLPQFERETGNRSYRRAVRDLRARVVAWGCNDSRLPNLREYPRAPTSGILTALLRLDAAIPFGHQTARWRYHYTEIVTYLAQDWALARSADDARADALQRNPNAIKAYYEKGMLAAELLDREIADAQPVGKRQRRRPHW